MYYKITPNYKDCVLITDSRFLKNTRYKGDLYGDTNVKQPIITNPNKESANRFPKIWTSNGSIQKIPKSNPLTVQGLTIYDKISS